MYGTTANGGSVVKRGACGLGCGTMYRISQTGRRTTIHDFRGADGDQPLAQLLAATDGRLYGTTTSGDGRQGRNLFSAERDGSDFRIEHYFDGTGGAANPQGALIELSDVALSSGSRT